MDLRCSFRRLVAAAMDLQKNNSKGGFKIVHFSIKVAIPGSKSYCIETTSAEIGAWEYISNLQPTLIETENVRFYTPQQPSVTVTCGVSYIS
jgi:hypothetical protein